MTVVRDRMWIWTHAAGSYNGMYGLTGVSRMTPVESACYLDVPNACMIVFGDNPQAPFDPYAIAFRPLQQVAWSILGDSSSARNDYQSDLDEVIALASKYPNITGAVMDDFFCVPEEQGALGRADVAVLEEYRRKLHAATPPLDLWTVIYSRDLAQPIAEYLDPCDILTLWHWETDDLANLDTNMARLEAIAPNKRTLLGCYMWDFHHQRPMPIATMEHQCTTGLRWLREGRIEGMIFVSSSIADLELEAVEWTRHWLHQVGGLPLTA